MIGLAPLCQAQWKLLDGPNGGSISALSSQGSRLFAGTQDGGVFISDDTGLHWKRSNIGFTSGHVTSIMSKSGGVVLLGTDRFGSYSTNSGNQWLAFAIGFPNEGVTALGMVGTTLLAGTANGLYISNTDGVMWSPVNSGLSGQHILSIASTSQNVYVATASGVYVSTNQGLDWLPFGTGLPASITNLSSDGVSVYAFSNTQSLLFRVNGPGWSPVSAVGASGSMRAMAFVPNKILAVMETGVYVSMDNGSSWTQTNQGLEDESLTTIMSVGGDLFVGTLASGIFKSTDGGASWQLANRGLNSLAIKAVFYDGSTLFAGAMFRGVFASNDMGVTWTNVSTGLPVGTNDVTSISGNADKIFAGTSGGGVYSTTNAGANWLATNTGLGDLFITSLAISSTVVYAGTLSGGIFVSVDGGGHWSSSNSGMTDLRVRSVLVRGGNAFVATPSGVFMSSDDGAHWNAANNGLSNLDVRCLIARGTHLFAGTFGSGIFRSDDNGGAWVTANGGLLTNTSVQAMVAEGPRIHVTTKESGMLFSRDDGTTWIGVNDVPQIELGGNKLTIQSYAVAGPNLIAGAVGVWSRPLNDFKLANFVIDAGHPDIITIGDPGFKMKPITNSGLPVTLSTNSDRINLTGDQVTLLQPGFASVFADQEGDESYLPIVHQGVGFCIYPIHPDIQQLPNTDGLVNLSSTCTSGNQWYKDDRPIPSATSVIYQVYQNGTYYVTTAVDNCESMPSATISFNKPSNTISFVLPDHPDFGDAPIPLNIRTSSGLPPKITSASFKISLAGNVMTILGAGEVTIQVDQPGNADYFPALTLHGTFCIGPASPLISLDQYISGKATLSSNTFGNQWYLNGQKIRDAVLKTFEVFHNGIYTVTSNFEKCESRPSAPFQVLITGIDRTHTEFQAYPNPVRNILTIQNGSQWKSTDITIVNTWGDVLLKRVIPDGEYSLDLSELPAGIYQLLFRSGENLRSLRFVKE